jgi:hypothetical protein
MDELQYHLDRAEQLLQLAAVTLSREDRRVYLQQSAEWRDRAEALRGGAQGAQTAAEQGAPPPSSDLEGDLG